MFAGIGGFRTGLTRAGGFRCVGHCEIDKYANASYEAIYEPGKEERYYPDATKIDPADLPDFDLLCGGFPCQAFSIAGRRKGFDDTRGTLFFEIARLVKSKRPSYLLLENVPGLLSHDKGRTFSVILATLNDLGYRVEWMVLNSKHFGVPQSRRRLLLICYLDPRCAGKIFPIFGTGGKAPRRLARLPCLRRKRNSLHADCRRWRCGRQNRIVYHSAGQTLCGSVRWRGETNGGRPLPHRPLWADNVV